MTVHHMPPTRIRSAIGRAIEALKATEALDERQCDECEGEGEPEACPLCFPKADDARLLRRSAIDALETALTSGEQ